MEKGDIYFTGRKCGPPSGLEVLSFRSGGGSTIGISYLEAQTTDFTRIRRDRSMVPEGYTTVTLQTQDSSGPGVRPVCGVWSLVVGTPRPSNHPCRPYRCLDYGLLLSTTSYTEFVRPVPHVVGRLPSVPTRTTGRCESRTETEGVGHHSTRYHQDPVT